MPALRARADTRRKSPSEPASGRPTGRALRWGVAAGVGGLMAFALAGPGAGIADAATTTYEVSFQANNNVLYSYTSAGTKTPTTLGMLAGTSPSSAQLSDGTFISAFQDNAHDLYLYKWAGTKISTTLGMDAGTSPALAGLPTGAGWVAAFQTNNNDLYIYTSAGKETNTGLGMEAGTSPAIAVQADGSWAVAFQANNGTLHTYTSTGSNAATTDGMNTTSSPSIAALPNGSYEIAFEANNSNLDTFHTGGSTTATGLGMDTGTSPSLAVQGNGNWDVGFQTNNNVLDTYSYDGDSAPTSDAMAAGTSPSVIPDSGGTYDMAFEANNDNLDVFHTGGSTNATGLGMLAGTSPSLAPTPPTTPGGSTGAQIVSWAESQVSYQDNPAGTYCNAFSAYWDAGTADCGNTGNLDETWCADFAAWAWRKAGVAFTYGFAAGDIDAGAASFYTWGVDHGTWHAAGSGYTPQPGDAVIYGLNSAGSYADHVAIVTSFTAGDAGPNVVNGDWWSTGNGEVIAANDQTTATGSDGISGYVTP